MAVSGLTISGGADSGVTSSGPNDCTYTAQSSSSNVNVAEVDQCLEDGDAVSITDGQGGYINVDAAIAPSTCTDAPLTLDEESGDIDIASPVGIGSCDLDLDAATAITQTAAITTAGALHAPGQAAITLTDAGNDIAAFEGGSVPGAIDLSDAAGTLDLMGISGSDGFTISNAGNIDDEADLTAPGSAASLTSTSGSVTETGGAVSAASLTVAGTAVSLPGPNAVTGTLNATATNGNVSAYLYYAPTSLGNLEATNGTVSVTNGDKSLQPTGTISGQSITLDADGIIAAAGNSALLAAPSVAITDTDPSDAWTVTPSTIAAAGTGTIAYSGASSLSIGGNGGSFNVTPSSATTMTFNGGSPAAGTLTYDAQGRVVSGTTTAPSGAIDSTGVEPVNFSGMTAVTLNDPATTTTGGGSGGGSSGGATGAPGDSSSLPTCTLRASSTRVKLPRRVHGKLKGKATLTFVATCRGSVHVILSAGITVVSKAAHGKKKSKRYGIRGVRASAAAGAQKKIVLVVPNGAVSALAAKGDKLSATATLADTDHGGSVLKTITIKSLT